MKNHRQIILLLGSNIDPAYNLPRAIQLLSHRFPIGQVSSVWETSAIGSEGPNFLNAAIQLESILSPQALKKFVLRPLEAHLGRVRTADKNAPRTIDLDVVVWDSRTWDDDIWHYAHAAVPVAELAPDLHQDPYPETLAQIAQKLRAETEIWLSSDITWYLHSQMGILNREFMPTTNRFDEVARSTGW